MPGTPAVSAVIPLYNKGPSIVRALNSILAQTFQDFETIVVDDGSTDDGAELVKEFDDPRIRLIQQENRGVSAARNRGIKEARADLIAFLDADDEWLPAFIETILRLRALYPDAGLYGTAYEVHFPGSRVPRIYNRDRGERLLSSYFGDIITFGYEIFNASSCAAKKEVLIDVGCFPEGVPWNEDGTLWGKIALQFSIAYSPKICSIYHHYSAKDSTGITAYLEHPFLHYLSTIPNDELLKRDDEGDLQEYRDLCRLAVIWRNIYAGHGARARKELSSVTSPRCTREKNKLQILSYIPPQVLRIIRAHAKDLSHLKRIIIRP